jgi:predicted RND superfamily exporter protein
VNFAERFCAALCRRAGWILLSAAGLALFCGLLAARLQLRTDIAELLPSSDPSVAALRQLQQRLPPTEALIINIRASQPAAAQAFADALVDRLHQLPPERVGLAVAHVKEEQAWFKHHQGLYVDEADLRGLRDGLQAAVQQAKHPLSVDLLDDAEAGADPQTSLRDLEKKLTAAPLSNVGALLQKHFREGYFSTPDGLITSVVVMPPGGMFHEHAGEQLAPSVLQIIKELAPQEHGIDEVGLSGEIKSSLDERDALENDLVLATGLSISLVCLVVVLYFGQWRALPLLATPALLGALVAFAFAQRAFGYLNSSTAFLASIIVGNGVNFAIIQLARYAEERRAGTPVPLALARSVGGTVQATGMAALAASIAYGSLTVTQFRGFSQFGLIGGVGMLAAWLAALLLLPPMLYLMDRHAPDQVEPRRRASWDQITGWLVRRLQAVERAPGRVVGLGVLLSIVGLLALPSYLRDPFEYNFRNLRSSLSDDPQRGEARWYAANGQTFGRVLNPLVMLAGSVGEVEAARTALRQADSSRGGPPMLESIVSFADLLPGSLDEQNRKIPVLLQLRQLMLSNDFKRLPSGLRERLMPYLPPAELHPVRVDGVPQLLRRFFTEVDGQVGRPLLLFVNPAHYNSWDGRDMVLLDQHVGDVEPMPGVHRRTVGSAMIFAGMIRSIVRDGPLATAASAAGVLLLVGFSLRRRPAGVGLVLATLLAGFLWTIGSAALFGVKINFLNFVALPVTLGIGVDYGINIYMRVQLEGPGRLWHAVRATGGAVALCSATTIIGYGALLVADNRALRSFGSLAIGGEVACLAAALLMMPAYLQLKSLKKKHPAAQ